MSCKQKETFVLHSIEDFSQKNHLNWTRDHLNRTQKQCSLLMNPGLAYTDRSPTITDVRYPIYRASSGDYFKILTGITSSKQKSLKDISETLAREICL